MNEEQVAQHIMAMQRDLATLGEQMKEALRRIGDQEALTKSVGELASSMKVMANEQKRMGEEQCRLRQDVDALRLKPGTRWEAVVGQIITLLVAAGAGFGLSKLFGG